MKRFFQTRAAGLLIALVILCGAVQAQQLKATRVETAGFTVSDMDRSIDFYTRVLHFQKVGDRRNADVKARVVRMQLGEEQIELTQYDAKGRPFPADSHGNDHWFHHVAIVVSDMPKAYACCGRTACVTPRARRSGCRTGTRTPLASKRSTSAIPTGTTWS